MDVPLRTRPRRGWEDIDNDCLRHIINCTDFLTAARLGGSCTNYFRTVVRAHASDQVMILGLPCVLEEHLYWWAGPAEHGRRCTITPLECPTLEGMGQELEDDTRILALNQVSDMPTLLSFLGTCFLKVLVQSCIGLGRGKQRLACSHIGGHRGEASQHVHRCRRNSSTVVERWVRQCQFGQHEHEVSWRGSKLDEDSNH
jgi:hypothetical protein